LTPGGSDTGSDGVGIVGNMNGRIDALGAQDAGEFVGQSHAFDLGEVWRVFDDALSRDAGDRDANSVDAAFSDHGEDFAGEDFNEFANRESIERVDFIDVLGIANCLSHEAHIFEPAGNNVFSNDDADCGSHFALRAEKACADKNFTVKKDARAPEFSKLVIVIPPGSGAGGRVR
jgi:hypothetical protein